MPLRLLLRHPLVTSDGPHAEGFVLVRRHRDALARDLRQVLGYRLVVEPGFARLYKAGLGPTGRARCCARPGRRSHRAPTPTSSLCCAVLLTSRQQVLLSSLVEQVRHAGIEAGLEWGDDTMADRRAFVAALRQLVDWGVLVEDDGTVGAPTPTTPTAEALLFVRRDLVRHLLAVPLREVESPDDLVQPGRRAEHRRRRPPPCAPSPGRGARRARRRSRRRVVGLAAPVATPRGARLEEAFGLQLEIRAEGVAAIDPRDELTDMVFPRGGTLGHAALLTAAELARRLRPADASRRRDRRVGAGARRPARRHRR